MIEKARFITVFDLIGVSALFSGILTLVGIFCFSSVARSAWFSIFLVSLTIAISTFLVARIAQIAILVVNNPYPRKRRLKEEAAPNLPTPIALFAAEAPVVERKLAA